LPVEIAPERERSGPSGQVVSRYVAELPRSNATTRSVTSIADVLGKPAAMEAATSVEWAQSVARHACRMAVAATGKLQRGLIELASVAGLLRPLNTAAPPPAA
jgi:hypothetical protein